MIIRTLRWRPRLWHSAPSSIRLLSQAPAPSLSPASSGGLALPSLRIDNEASLRNKGVPGLYQPHGLSVAWYDYQGWCVRQLNERITNTTMEGWLPRDILIKTARDPENAALFNYASMAFNNHFYFDGLSLTGEPVPMPRELERFLSDSFSSVETLKSEFLQTAQSMFGPGFVWLVRTKATHQTNSRRPFHILTTYLAGSPLAGAHNRLQPKDLNTENIVTAGGVSNENFVRSRVQNTVGSFGPWSRAEATPATSYGGIDVVPVMCVNTWEHAWMFDWTIEGKWQFLQAWWDRIDWNHVEKIAIATSRKT